jgi:uncharacterized protein YcfL
MSPTQFSAALLALFLLAGCGSAPEESIAPAEPEPAADADSTSMEELLDRNIRTADLGVSRLKDRAKTVGYGPGGTEVGEKLLDDAIVVDHITRQDADNHYGVTVTLFNNREDGPAVFEWRIAFFNEAGAEVGSLRSTWTATAIGAKSWGRVSNFATVRGAVSFKVEARPKSAAKEAPAAP